MAGKIQSPEKELRFTRSGQASLFWIASAVLTAVGITMLATAVYRDFGPQLAQLWTLLPFSFAAFMAHAAIKLTRHAYLILTPLGIEIFPFFKPADGMRLILWQEIDHAEVDEKTTRLTLHHDAEKTSGIHLSLTPIRADRRTLLAKAVIGRVSPPAANG
ncbi:MAG: hypothetical protein ABIS50_08780 [Luteolibacter sp.]|uniref:hypothetical protein n=1 Tax=Luteolibacter sp. TaxID=1962973 RepID=UPI0032673AA9